MTNILSGARSVERAQAEGR